MPTPLKSILLIACATIVLACGVPAIALPSLNPSPTAIVPTDTPVPPATDTATPAATDTAVPPTFTAIPADTSTPTTAPGIPVTYGNVSLTIPGGLASGTTNSSVTDVELPYINPSNGDMPQHSKLLLNDYPLQGTLLSPQILVFPADAFANYGDLTGQIVSTLHDVPYMDGQPLPAGLPDGPFSSHVGAITFTHGHGIRYLTQIDQAPLPVNNREMFYYFHGLTDDGNIYIEAILPVNAAFLPADENPDNAPPAGGIPFTMDDLGSYFQSISDKLNATPPEQFKPSLSALDALLDSIVIK